MNKPQVAHCNHSHDRRQDLRHHTEKGRRTRLPQEEALQTNLALLVGGLGVATVARYAPTGTRPGGRGPGSVPAFISKGAMFIGELPNTTQCI